MSNKIIVCTFTQNPYIDEEFNRFKQFIADQTSEIELEHTTSSEEDIFNQLISDKANILLLPLHKVPITLPVGITIGALSERKEMREALIINQESYDDNEDFRIRLGATIAVQNDRQRYQIAALRSDLVFKDNKNKADAFFDENLDNIPDNKVIVRLNPKEFVPEPGYGVFAWLTLVENIEMRKLLKNIHHKETAEQTNIERKVYKANIDPELNFLGAYAYYGQDGHAHLFTNAMYKGRFVSKRLSQSTNANISENLIEAVKSITVNQ